MKTLKFGQAANEWLNIKKMHYVKFRMKNIGKYMMHI